MGLYTPAEEQTWRGVGRVGNASLTDFSLNFILVFFCL